jgi:hypothetical protein
MKRILIGTRKFWKQISSQLSETESELIERKILLEKEI